VAKKRKLFSPRKVFWSEKNYTLQKINFFEDRRTAQKKIVLSIPKACGKAVLRNKLRRQLRGQFLEILKDYPVNEGLWIRIKRKALIERDQNALVQSLLKQKEMLKRK